MHTELNDNPIRDNQPIFIRSGEGQINDSILSGIFREMFRRAVPVVKFYEGDLFHDALWIKANIAGPSEDRQGFYYGVRDTGTSIGFDESLVSYSNKITYYVVLTQTERDAWFVQFIPTSV
jgi:hypothetical protein